MSQPGQGQSGFAAARRANAQRANQNNPLPPPANNSNQLVAKINQIFDSLSRNRGGVTEFLTRTEPDFIARLRQYINDISTNLAQLNIENEADRLTNKTAQLRQASEQLRQQVQQLSDQNTQITQDRDRLNQVNQQLSNDNQQLAQSSQQLRDENAAKTQIIDDATNALARFDAIINDIQTDANGIQQKTQAYDDINRSLDALSQLVNTKLAAYQRLQSLEQQGGKQSKGKRRTKKYKKMRGGYSYPSAGYEGAQEIIVAPSRSARSRSRRSSSARRQSKRRPKTI